MLSILRSLPDRLTSRRGAWVALGVAVLVLVAVMGVFASASVSSGNDTAATGSESARVAALAGQFPDSDRQTVLIVASRHDQARLDPADTAALGRLVPAVQSETGEPARGPIVSADGRAAMIQAGITPADSGTTGAVKSLRSVIGEHPIAGLAVQVTGGPAFGADIASAFDGADITLLLVTLVIVAVLLIGTYRSPILWMVPLAVVAVGEQVADKVTSAVGDALGLQFQTGVLSVLVFGAGTNYALLLVSRYREKLAAMADHRAAMAAAWRKTLAAIVASNVTVVASLLILGLAVVPGTRGLGIASAIGLVIAVAAVLFVLPPALVVCGRQVFWPFVPRVGESTPVGPRWRTVATKVVRRPWIPLVGGVVLLAVMASGLIGTSVGLSQIQKFRVSSESVAGLEVLGAHFPAGEAQPMTIIADSSQAGAVTRAVQGVDGVVRVTPAGTSTGGGLTKLMVTGAPAPGTARSLDLVRDVRSAAHGVPGADALVGGPVAADVDLRQETTRDLLLIAPLVLAVTLAVLIVLMRALLAPVLLLVVNAASALAAIGAGAFFSRILFGGHGLDLAAPLLAFLFLVALGIDYTIFLVHRIRDEAHRVGTRAGVVNAVASTGGVITSAGIVLAAVFAALAVVPLVTIGQIGLIVGIGVFVDTFVVRTFVVPAVFALLGDRVWHWAGAAPRRPGPARVGRAG
jgi:RND superfamily putative drug exporter